VDGILSQTPPGFSKISIEIFDLINMSQRIVGVKTLGRQFGT
jgi:hypothetical protein